MNDDKKIKNQRKQLDEKQVEINQHQRELDRERIERDPSAGFDPNMALEGIKGRTITAEDKAAINHHDHPQHAAYVKRGVDAHIARSEAESEGRYEDDYKPTPELPPTR